MDITLWNISDAAKLAAFYNAQIADTPFCYPVTPEEFGSGIIYHEEGNPGVVSQEKLIVGLHQARIVGFSHVAKQAKKNGDIGTIRFFRYLRGFRTVGQTILEESERYLHSLGLSEIQGCPGPGYRFHRSRWDATLTNSTGHVRALFGINGYQLMTWGEARPAGHAFMHVPLDQETEPNSPDAEIETEVVYARWDRWEPGPEDVPVPNRGDLPNLTIWLWRGDRKIGRCQAWSMGHYC
jgi:hypothetical protein